MICMYRNVVFSVKVLLPLIHARDDGKAFLFNLSVVLLSVVQSV